MRLKIHSIHPSQQQTKEAIARHRFAPLGQTLIRSTVLGLLVGTLPLASLAVTPAPAQSVPSAQTKQQQSNPILLGVVRSDDNRDEWSAIASRLKSVGIQYTMVDLESLETTEPLANLTVLFLPNVETLSSAQVITLGNWMNQGGRLVVSGAIGQESSYGVQRALRSLIGAYWSSTLEQPSGLSYLTEEGAVVTADLDGGTLQPSGLTSQTLATWAETASAAVVATQRTVVLGWNWGTDNAPNDVDVLWLQLALSRFGNLALSPVLTTPITTSPPSDTMATQDSPARTAPPESAVTRPVPARPSTPETETPRSRPTAPAPVAPPVAPLSRISPAPTTSADPAEQVAPAGVPVEISSLPISVLEAIAMRQELENLIGRFESALLAANSATTTISLSQDVAAQTERRNEDSTLVASSERDLSLANPPNVASSAAAEQAREILSNFSQLIRNGEYETARRQWLEARQMLWDNMPTDRPLAQPEVRAIWLDRGTIVDAGSKQRLAIVFDQLAASGINTVFVETVNAGYPIYPSNVAPEQNPLTRHWDPLQAAVELGHERGMEVHAWVWTFATGNTRHNELLNQPSSYLGPVLDAHPSWAAYDNGGRVIPLGQTKPFLDPANPEVRRYLLSLYQEIITNYDVDGLQLDYIRYPFQDPSANRTYGYGTAAREQFQRLTGVDPADISPNDRDLWEQWTAFRIEQINSFVEDVDALLERTDPSLILSTAVFAMSEHERIQKIQQNWEVWAQEGHVDMVVTMSYAMDTNRLQRLAGPWVASEELGSALIIPSIRLLSLSELATFDQIQALRDMPSSGYALFAAENLSDSDALQDIFSRTQGQPNPMLNADPIPYRDPFGTAAARYDALLREWSFLLSNGDLYIPSQQYDEWQAAAEALSASLHQLADDPSEAHLQQAQQQLDQFQAGFGDWMESQGWSNDYRVETWANRLQLLDTLLGYGDRTLAQR